MRGLMVLIKIVYQVKRTSKPGMRNSVPISTRLLNQQISIKLKNKLEKNVSLQEIGIQSTFI